MAKVATRSIAAGADDKGAVRGWWDQSVNFLRDVRTEMRKVTVPSMKEVRATTGVVIVTVALFAIFFYTAANIHPLDPIPILLEIGDHVLNIVRVQASCQYDFDSMVFCK